MRVEFEETFHGLGQEYVYEDELYGLGAMTTGEALVDLKLDVVKKAFRSLGYGTSGLRSAIGKMRALKADALTYLGQPKAGTFNAEIDRATKKQESYLTRYSGGNSAKRRIEGQIKTLKGILMVDMPETAPPPQVPSPAETKAIVKAKPEAKLEVRREPAAKPFVFKSLLLPAVAITVVGYFGHKFLRKNFQ